MSSKDNETQTQDFTAWICGRCNRRRKEMPTHDETCECGVDMWTEVTICADCDVPMKYDGASNRLGTQSVSYEQCPQCKKVVL